MRYSVFSAISVLTVYAVAFCLTRRLRKIVYAPIASRSVVVVSILTLFFTIILSQQVPIGGMEYILYYLYSMFSALMVLFIQYGLMRADAGSGYYERDAVCRTAAA